MLGGLPGIPLTIMIVFGIIREPLKQIGLKPFNEVEETFLSLFHPKCARKMQLSNRK